MKLKTFHFQKPIDTNYKQSSWLLLMYYFYVMKIETKIVKTLVSIPG